MSSCAGPSDNCSISIVLNVVKVLKKTENLQHRMHMNGIVLVMKYAVSRLFRTTHCTPH